MSIAPDGSMTRVLFERTFTKPNSGIRVYENRTSTDTQAKGSKPPENHFTHLRSYTTPDGTNIVSSRGDKYVKGVLDRQCNTTITKDGKTIHQVSYSPRSQKPSKPTEGESLLHADGSSKLNVLPGELRNQIFDQAVFSLQKEGRGWLGALLDLKQSRQTRTALEQDPQKFNKSHPVTQRDILEKAVDSGNPTLAADLSHGLPAQKGSARARLTQKRDTVLRNTFSTLRKNLRKSRLK